MLPGKVLLLQRLRHEVGVGRPRVQHREIQRGVRGRLVRLLSRGTLWLLRRGRWRFVEPINDDAKNDELVFGEVIGDEDR
eukprot:10558389-Heterocapsa_arctica.AAC.1